MSIAISDNRRLSKGKDFFSISLTDNSVAGITFKSAGNFHINESRNKALNNAKRLLSDIGIIGDVINESIPVVVMGAHKHTDKVLYFEKQKKSFSSEEKSFETLADYEICDGIIFKGKGIGIFYPGGCAPVVLRDQKADLTGIIHCGWKPVAQGIIDKFFALWEKKGGNPINTELTLLPNICHKCLEYDTIYFYEKIFPHIINLFKSKNVQKPAKTAKEFCIDISEKNKTLFMVPMLVEHLLYRRCYYELSKFNECICGKNCANKKDSRYWCYRHDDTITNKYRGAVFAITY